MKIEIIILFSLCLVFAIVQVQGTTVRASIGTKLIEATEALQTLLWNMYIVPKLAGYLPSVTPANFTCCTNFTEISFNQTTITSAPSAIIPGVGFRVNFTSFTTTISWTLNWKYGNKTGVLYGNSKVTITNLSIKFTIQNNAGVPKLQILNLTVIDWSVDPANYSLPPALEKAPYEAIKTLMTEKFQNSFSEYLNVHLNSMISQLFGTGGLEIPLNLKIVLFTLPLFVNYQLSEDLVFSEKDISVGLEVRIRLNNTKCPIKDKLLPALNQTHDVLISISRTILDCLFNDIATTDLGLYVTEKKIFDSRFQANVFSSPNASWVPSNFSTTIETNVDIPVYGLLKTVIPSNNTVYDLAQFIINASATIKIEINGQNQQVYYGLKDKSLNLDQLSCNPVPNSRLNARYADQLKKENWSELARKIISGLPPGIYAQNSYVPPLVFELLGNIGWLVNPDWVTIQADCKIC